MGRICRSGNLLGEKAAGQNMQVRRSNGGKSAGQNMRVRMSGGGENRWAENAGERFIGGGQKMQVRRI